MEHSSNDRLATYGTLAPGRSNHHHLSDLRGVWQRGTVRGRLIQEGWGAALGFPGMVSIGFEGGPLPQAEHRPEM